MNDVSTQRIIKTILAACAVLVVFAVATTADAQDREGRWEFTLGTFYQLGTTVDGQEGTGLETDNDFGFELGGGFNFTDNLATTFNLQWAGVGYDATALDEDLNPVDISGKYDAFTVSGIRLWSGCAVAPAGSNANKTGYC